MKTLTAFSTAVTAMATTTAGLAVYGNRRLQHRLTQTKGELAQARSSALRDPLTGLANRSAIAAELQRRAAAGTPFALFLIDLDGFKPVNDTYGHPVGDLVLTEIARRLSDGPVLDGDVLGRLGGDEFLLIADSNTLYTTGVQAPAICRMVRRPVTAGSVRVQVSASVGVLQVLPDDDLDDAMRSVDAAMYRAKAAGGDRFADYGAHDVPLLDAGDTRPVLRLRDAHPHRVASHPLLSAGVGIR